MWGRRGAWAVVAAFAACLFPSVLLGGSGDSSAAHVVTSPPTAGPLGAPLPAPASHPSSVALQDGGEGVHGTSWVDRTSKSSPDREGQRVSQLQLDLTSPVALREGLGQFRLGTEHAFIDLSLRGARSLGLTTGQHGPTAGGAGKESATLSLSRVPFRDLLEDLGRPPLFTTSLSTTITLAPPAWPRLALRVSRMNQESGADPLDAGNRVAFPLVDSTVNSLSAQLDYPWRFLTFSAGATRSRTLENAWSAGRTNLLAYNAGLSWKLLGGRLVLAPALSWTQDRTTAAPESSSLERTFQGALTATAILMPDELTFSSRIRLSRAHTTDGETAERTVTTDAAARLTWRVEKYLGDHGRRALSFQLNWNRVTDAVTPTNSQNEYGVFLLLDVSAPFLL